MTLVTTSLLMLATVALAENPPARVDYLGEIKPLLAARCYTCHGVVRQKGDLRLDTVAFMKKGGSNGAALIPGQASRSLLIQRICAPEGKKRMPPEADGERLPDAQIKLLHRWIEEGANGPADEKPEPDPREHWAFRLPRRPSLPTRKNRDGGQNPIDAFLAVEHEKRGLTPQPLAEKRLLLRRVTLDLTGLPPTRQEYEAFLNDHSPEAYDKVVDRLLASKQYGERWGRHWMDVWRYSDWWGLGAEVRNSQKHIWHWRDWIIESLNEDKGYDQMILEMLAADEVAPTDLKALRATGFLVRQYFKFNRTSWLDETVEHTGKAFLGLTLNCVKCHEHKYDPISHVEYYRLRAFFEPYQIRHDQLAGEMDLEKDSLPRVFDCNLDAPTYVHVRGNEANPRKDRPIQPGVPAFLELPLPAIKAVVLPAEASSPGLRPWILHDHLEAANRAVKTAEDNLTVAQQKLKDAEATAVAPKAPARETTQVKPVVRDDFSTLQSKLWAVRGGEWRVSDGKLAQLKQESMLRGVLRLQHESPSDFEARIRFSITGGTTYRSVGLCFDVGENQEDLVYLSAYSGGSKLQIAHKQGGVYSYPPTGMQARKVPLNQSLELLIRVRGRLVNVSINKEHALAYLLPHERKPGPLELITFDATARFELFELAPLPTDCVLIEGGKKPATPLTRDQLKLALTVAEKTLAHARLVPVTLKARDAAERATIAKPQSTNAGTLRRQAAHAERQLALAQAELTLAQTELEVARAIQKTSAENKRTAARKEVALARKALEQVSENYTPISGALKSPESNLESENSRHKPFPTTSTGRRTALARWIIDPRNPLTARVAVNHVWLRHFGAPLVPTVFDFGRKGAPPTHPELLDYLAVELMEKRWSLKHLHRLMVTSHAYRRSSSSAGTSEKNLLSDAENRYYWRMNSLRMESQVLRDSLFYLAGELNLSLGGPSVEPSKQDQSRRRSLYFFHSANERNRFLTTFDDADVLDCYRRRESIIPQQALALSNSKLTHELAPRLAARLEKELGSVNDAAFARQSFILLLGITPTVEEQRACEEALGQLQKSLANRKVANPKSRARAQLVHALLNHNDFITIR